MATKPTWVDSSGVGTQAEVFLVSTMERDQLNTILMAVKKSIEGVHCIRAIYRAATKDGWIVIINTDLEYQVYEVAEALENLESII